MSKYTKYYAHDEKREAKEGDVVEIVETRPLSKQKRFRLVRVVQKSKAAEAEFVLPAMYLRDGMIETLQPYRRALAGKIWIDITNPFNADYTDFILPWDTSAAEDLRRRFPEARIVGAFKNVWWEVFDAPVTLRDELRGDGWWQGRSDRRVVTAAELRRALAHGLEAGVQLSTVDNGSSLGSTVPVSFSYSRRLVLGFVSPDDIRRDGLDRHGFAHHSPEQLTEALGVASFTVGQLRSGSDSRGTIYVSTAERAG